MPTSGAMHPRRFQTAGDTVHDNHRKEFLRLGDGRLLTLPSTDGFGAMRIPGRMVAVENRYSVWWHALLGAHTRHALRRAHSHACVHASVPASPVTASAAAAAVVAVA